MATSPEDAFRRLVRLYLFDRPEGASDCYVLADLVAPGTRYWLGGVLTRMVNDGELLYVDSGRSGESKVYRLAASAWVKLLREEPEHWIETLKKFKLLPS